MYYRRCFKTKDIILTILGIIVVLAFILVLVIASYAFIDMAFLIGDLFLEIASICFPIVTFGILFIVVCELG